MVSGTAVTAISEWSGHWEFSVAGSTAEPSVVGEPFAEEVEEPRR